MLFYFYLPASFLKRFYINLNITLATKNLLIDCGHGFHFLFNCLIYSIMVSLITRSVILDFVFLFKTGKHLDKFAVNVVKCQPIKKVQCK